MKTLFKNLIDLLAQAALLEEGVPLEALPSAACEPVAESLEDNLVEVAFAEAADYDEIHNAIQRERRAHCAAA